MSADPAASREFYASVFGFTFEEMGGEDMDYTTFSAGGNLLGGIGGTMEGMPTGWLSCFAVENTDQAVATIESNGGTVSMPPMDTPFGRFAIVADPWGAAFEVMGPAQG
jgi:predicted enzyme related to lactoylglutathione lyase